MKNKQVKKDTAKAILLNKQDNIIIALDNMQAKQYLKEFDLTTDAPILSGQKIARVDMIEDTPIYKYGTIIGFADSNIVKGQVLSLIHI